MRRGSLSALLAERLSKAIKPLVWQRERKCEGCGKRMISTGPGHVRCFKCSSAVSETAKE